MIKSSWFQTGLPPKKHQSDTPPTHKTSDHEPYHQRPPLTISPRIRTRLQQNKLTPSQVEDFQLFLQKVDREFMKHRIITHNEYSHWFSHGLATDEELCHFIRQFSVFSNQFLVAALYKVINSPTLQQSRASREILLNELGVIYRKTRKNYDDKQKQVVDEDKEGDPSLVSTEGTVDGGICRFGAAHFEWLTKVAQCVGLEYKDIGKRKHGRETTLYFCDELKRLYGSDDMQIAQGASFAVENWASAGFWQDLVDGLLKIKEKRLGGLKVAFFTWHNMVEAQHAKHTLEELEDVYFEKGFDQEKFFQGGRETLDAIAVFWNGLEQDRLNQVFM